MPRNRHTVQLHILADLVMGQSPNSQMVNDKERGTPFLQGNAEFSQLSPNPTLWCTQPRKLCQSGDVLISVRAPVGALNLADQQYCIGRGLAAVSFQRAWPSYGWHILNYFAKDLRRVAQGTTFEAINKEDLKTLKIEITTSHDEQRQIAAILDTVDAAIRQTETLIAKFKLIRTGLLKDLLTHGLDAHDNLRDPNTNPTQFNLTPEGAIPKQWETVKLAREINVLHGYAFEGNYFSSTPPGTVLLVPGNFHRDGGLYFHSDNTKYYQGLIPQNYILDNGSLLIVMTDLSPHTLILGRVVCLQEGFKVLHNQRIGKIVIKRPATWNPTFLMSALNDERVRKNIIRHATGTTVRHTSPNRILSQTIYKPDIGEQNRIANMIRLQEAIIDTEKAYLAKLRLQKQGLLQDLLTGRVTVKTEATV